MAKLKNPNAKTEDLDGEETAAVGRVEQARVYNNSEAIDHDLFKLMPATMKKDVGYQIEDPIIVAIEHSHIFHTVDSGGKALTTCNAVGGHHHQINVVRSKTGVPSLEVSPPMRYIKQKVGKKYRTVSAPIEMDQHTHDVKYLGSEKIQLRRMNEEFAKLESQVKALHNPTVEGAFERG